MSWFGRWFGFDTESVYKEGLAALDRKNFAAAAHAFQVCIDESGRESTVRLARFYLAECFTQMAASEFEHADYVKAWEEIELAFAYAQPTADRHLLAAQIARHRGDRHESAIQVLHALAKSPEHTQARALQTAVMYEDGKTEEALNQAEPLLRESGRLEEFRKAHEQGDRNAAVDQLLALASSESL